jgi:hypothetical protein
MMILLKISKLNENHKKFWRPLSEIFQQCLLPFAPMISEEKKLRKLRCEKLTDTDVNDDDI